MKRLLNKFRYSPFGSTLLIFFAYPVFKVCRALIDQISKKVKLNGRTITYSSLRICFPKNVGIGFSSNIFWKGDAGFEPYTWKAIKEISVQADLLLDVGSHFGFYSVLVQKINPSIQTICYEPIPKLFQDNKIFHEANCTSRNTVLQVAISECEGELQIYVPSHEAINEVRSASLEKDFFYNRNFRKIELTVPVTTLDAEFKKKNNWIGKRILLKIDVEGHESKVLAGAIDFIQKCKPIIVCEIDKELDPSRKVVEVITRMDYSAYAIAHEGLFKIDLKCIEKYAGGRDFLLVDTSMALPDYVPFTDVSQLISRNWFSV